MTALLKEHVKSAPKELARRGMEDGAERLRTQLRDAAQCGQGDDYGGDKLEDAAAGGLRLGVRGAEGLLKQKKKGQSTSQPHTGVDPEPPPQADPDPTQIKTPESTWTEPQSAAVAEKHELRESADRPSVKIREPAQAQPPSHDSADRCEPRKSTARPAVKTREPVHEGTPDIMGESRAPHGDAVSPPAGTKDAVRRATPGEPPHTRMAEPAIKTKDACIQRQTATSGTRTPQAQAVEAGREQGRAATEQGVLRRRGPNGAATAEPAAREALPDGSGRPPGQQAGLLPETVHGSKAAKVWSRSPPPDTPQAVRQTAPRPKVRESRQTVKAAEHWARKITNKVAHPIKTVGAPSKTAGTAGRTTQAVTHAQQAISVRKAASARQTMASTRRAAKAAQSTAKKTAQAAGRALRAILAAAKSLAAAVMAGGGVVFVIILVICLIGLLLASPFGLFFSGEDSGTGYTMPDAVTLLNGEFSGRIEQIKANNPHDILEMDNAGSAAMISNWDDVLAVYAVRTATDDTSPNEVATLTEEKLSILCETFWDMNRISYWLESIPGGEDMADTIVLHIAVTIKDHLQMADEYGFTPKQRALLLEMMEPEYQELFMALTGSYQDIELSPEQVRDIVKNLPPGLSAQRRQVVLTAYQLLGKVAYFWGGKSQVLGWDSRWGTPMEVWAEGSSTTGSVRPFGLDCTGFIDWTLCNAGLPSEGHWYIGTNLTEVSWDEALPGDIALFPDASHVGIVVGRSVDGGILVCHCSYSQNNVVVTDCAATGFTAIGRLAMFD